LDELFVDKLKSGLSYVPDSKTMNIMNNMMVINMSIITRRDEDDNLLKAWRDTE
jgi:hypothetical protein